MRSRRNYLPKASRKAVGPTRPRYYKSPKRVKAGKKAAATRKRMARSRYHKLRVANWRRTGGPSRSLTVRRTRRGLIRSPYSRMGFDRYGRKVRINPYRRRRRRNPVGTIRRMLGRWRIGRALPLLVGFTGGVTLKPMVQNWVIPNLPVTIQGPVRQWWGVLTIVGGATLSNMGRRRMTKDVGLGMIVAGLYDVIASNFVDLPFIPKVTPGTMPGENGNGNGNGNNGSTQSGLGASIGTGRFVTVGAANISNDMEPDVVGSEDLDELI